MKRFRVITKPAKDPVLNKMIQPGGIVTVPDSNYERILRKAKCLGDEIKEPERATKNADLETRTKAQLAKELESLGVSHSMRQTKAELIDLLRGVK